MGFIGKLNEQANSLDGDQIPRWADGILCDLETPSDTLLAPC
jgi:hypothetical protein